MFYKLRLKHMLKKEQQWKEEEKLYEKELKYKERKQKLKDKHKLPSTSKLGLYFLFLNCTAIEVFSCYAVIKALEIGMVDFSPIVALIGAVVGEVVSFGIYSAKSKAENTVGGITYNMAVMDRLNKNSEECDE